MTKAHQSQFWKEAAERDFSSIFAIDFEGSAHTGVVEYGVVELNSQGIVGAWSAFCSPRKPLSALDTRTHGLRNEDLIDAHPFAKHWHFFQEIRNRGPFLAHAARVEDRFLTREWPSAGEVPNWLRLEGGENWEWGPWLDTLCLSRSIYRSADSHSLAKAVEMAELTEALNESAIRICPESRRKWHCALYDALASALLFFHFTCQRRDWGLWRFLKESTSSSSERSRLEQSKLF